MDHPTDHTGESMILRILLVTLFVNLAPYVLNASSVNRIKLSVNGNDIKSFPPFCPWCQDVALARAHGAVTKIDSSAAMLQLVDSPHRFIRLLLFMLVVMLYSGHPPLGLRSIQMKGQMEGPQRRRRDISSANSIFNTRLQMNQRSFCQMIAPTFNQNPAPSRKSKISSGKIRQQVQRTFSFSFNFKKKK